MPQHAPQTFYPHNLVFVYDPENTAVFLLLLLLLTVSSSQGMQVCVMLLQSAYANLDS